MQNPNGPSERGLPSLKVLIAFEATARLGSMTAAARELDSTQPAISQRVRQLEETLGCVLFERTGNRPSLTAHGARLYEDVSAALQQIEDAVRQHQAEARTHKRKVVVAANFGFAHLWLLPRLERLEAEFPELEFEIIPVDRDDAPEMAQADLGIRFGKINPDDSNERLLAPEVVFPICSPEFAQSRKLDADSIPDTLNSFPLLHMDTSDRRWLDWKTWCREANIRLPPIAPRMRYNNYPLLINAVKAGLGVALGWATLVDDLVATGSIVALRPKVRRDNYGYVIRSRFLDNSVIRPVSGWLSEEIRTARSWQEHDDTPTTSKSISALTNQPSLAGPGAVAAQNVSCSSGQNRKTIQNRKPD